ncbi:MAG: ergothioneine biosynthesis protein EgtC [Actinobacteria bacterium]|nr:ergothioneine biosynthesis protein EgtC [Actinomycetota bacterium]
MTLHSLVLAPPRSLLRQSWEARHQGTTCLNADGFGVGWYDRSLRDEPARYRTARPMWADRSFPSIAGLIASGAVVAAVRAASPGLPVEDSGNAPFTYGPWLFSHNGTVERFLEGVGVALRREVSDAHLGVIEGATDSEVLFAMVLDRLADGASPGDALDDVVTTVCAHTTARLNLLLSDGVRVAATTFGNSLFVRQSQDSLLIVSEPHDDSDDGWERIDDNRVVEATVGGLSVRERTA